jgi:hypothetical protein
VEEVAGDGPGVFSFSGIMGVVIVSGGSVKDKGV